MTAQPNRTEGDTVTVSRAELLRLARIARHLGPDRHRPERFHEDRSEIEAALRRLAGAKAEAAAP